MYLPFLRGKLYELKAVKEFIDEGYGKDFGRHIMPIIEPVKADTRPLISCVESMGKAKMPFAVVLNSRMGDYQRLSFDISDFLSKDRVQETQWTSAFEVNGEAYVETIEATIKDFSLRDVMLIFSSFVDLDDERIKGLVYSKAVKYVVATNLTQRPPIIAELKDAGKDIITLEDCFREKTPNNAYRDNLDEFFSDTFSYYKSLFGIFGFADYTAIGRNFRDRGALPQVVAIHMTYRKSDKVVNVHHFLSDSRNGTNNIRGEFKEANDKILPFYADKSKTLAIEQISSIDYPGLGAIKKFSIKNHFELMSRLLHEKED